MIFGMKQNILLLLIVLVPLCAIGQTAAESKDIEMAELVVRGRAPIVELKGDTTQFNANAFQVNPDADAEDLVNKMPGVMIVEGKIEAQGEPVRKIYIDGKLFFGTDPMGALKTIPADAIENIQLFDELSDQARISGVDDGEGVRVMNITTKNKDKKSTIARFETSYGADAGKGNNAGRYLAGGNFSRFEERRKLTLTAMTNNVNSARFGQGDNVSSSEVDSNGNPINQPAGLQNTGTLGADYSYQNVKKTLEFSGSYVAGYAYSFVDRFGETNYFPLPGRYESKNNIYSNTNHTERYTNKLNFRLRFFVSPRDIILIVPTANHAINQTHQPYGGKYFNYSEGFQDDLPLNRSRTVNDTDANGFTLSGYAMWTHRFKKRGRTLASTVWYNVNERSTESYSGDLLRESYSNGNWVATKPNKLQRRHIDQNLATNSLRFKATYAEPFAKYHRVTFNLMGSETWNSNDRRSARYNYAEGSYTTPDNAQSTYFKTDYYSAGGGVGYSYVNKKLTMSSSIDYQRLFQIRREYRPNDQTMRVQFNEVQPNFSLRYNIEKKRYLRVQYNGRTSLPRPEQMQSTPDTRSAQNITIGNPDLKPGYRHTMKLFYNVANPARSTNFTLTLNATAMSNFIGTSTEVNLQDSLYLGDYLVQRGAMMNRAINLDGYRSAKISATYSIGIKAIKSNLNLTGGFDYIRTPSVYGVLNYADIYSGNVRIGLTSNISRDLDFNFYTNTTYNYAVNTSRGNTMFVTENLSYSLNWIFLRGFVFNTLLTWKYYDSSTAQLFNNESQYLVNVGVGRKFLKRRNCEFRVTVYDLLNQSRTLRHYVRNTSIQDEEINTLGRYVMARLMYRFNSMTHKK